MMIAAPFRSRGLGADVGQAVEEWITVNGCVRTIQAGVQVNNPGALRFWQRMGYNIVSGAENMPDGTTVYHMEKSINL